MALHPTRFKPSNSYLWDGYLIINGRGHLYVAAKGTVYDRFTNIVLIMASHSSYVIIFATSQFCEML